MRAQTTAQAAFPSVVDLEASIGQGADFPVELIAKYPGSVHDSAVRKQNDGITAGAGATHCSPVSGYIHKIASMDFAEFIAGTWRPR